jgi:FkbM family methyltransferase
MWPASDKSAAAVLFSQAGDVEKVYPHVKKFDVVLQAGGNCGLWPRELGRRFSTVYTFEPDPVNFRCLCANAPDEHIFKFNAALGYERGPVSLNLRPDNVGAHTVCGAGNIPVIQIDDLALRECDLIYLDVEGFEEAVLLGAAETLDAHRPVVVVEDKGAGGSVKGELLRWLGAKGYKVVERFGHDFVLVAT